MTTKDIAQATGRDERSVQRWAKVASDKMSSIGDKLSSSSSAYPADYSLAETCFIIETGLGKAAADVYRTNAVQAEQMKAAQAPKVSGALVNAMFKMYGPIEGQRRIDYMLGITAPAAVKPVPQIEAKPQALPPQVARQVYAVAIKAMNKVLADNTAKALTPELF
jgi:hypothetical protein